MSPQSMRYSLPEVLTGMLASIQQERFTADTQRLAEMFEELSGKFELFEPFAAAVDADALSNALKELEEGRFIEREGEEYVLTDAGRAHCVRSKRTLFNQGDIGQLEQAAVLFQRV